MQQSQLCIQWNANELSSYNLTESVDFISCETRSLIMKLFHIFTEKSFFQRDFTITKYHSKTKQ